MVLVNDILSQIVQVDRPMAWGSLATLKPYASFNVDEDVDTLKKAIDAKGVDEASIVRILSNRTLEQRELIAKAFEKKFKTPLETVLAKKLSGYLENTMLTLLKSSAALDAQELKDAMKGLGTDEDTLIEILATRSNRELQDIKAVYKEKFQKDLEKDIAADATKRFQKLLLTLLKGRRDANSNVINYELIEDDAKALYAVASQKKNPDFDAWIPILTERSQNHLNRVFKLYKIYSSCDITDTIKKQMKGDDEKGFLVLVQCIQNMPEYFADRLYNSMKSLGTQDKILTRVLATRCEIDLLSIRAEYRKKYGKSLYSAIQADTKGDYQCALLGLCRAEDL
ncbi:annexin A2-like [Hemiscyllium ocellatum]|uniref:annexin A2-like n=1 Tax=Hemiscyllium ocellatum TaxID=170820 RepID=UPI0029668268|nr:annexin A2-like [Hemiscyllium ocellatum]